MLAAINIVWAIMLWRASDDPAQHLLFIDFTIWSNAAHGLVMVIATPLQKGPVMMVIESVPLLVVAAVLWWLRPVRSPANSPRVADKDSRLFGSQSWRTRSKSRG
jgi:hypothetical protein